MGLKRGKRQPACVLCCMAVNLPKGKCYLSFILRRKKNEMIKLSLGLMPNILVLVFLGGLKYNAQDHSVLIYSQCQKACMFGLVILAKISGLCHQIPRLTADAGRYAGSRRLVCRPIGLE